MLTKETQDIANLIGQGEFKKALKKLQRLEKQNPSDRILQLNKGGFLIDIGFGLKKPKIVRNGTAIQEQNLNNPKIKKNKELSYYNLANGYSALYQLLERRHGIKAIPQSDYLQKAKFYFREAIKLSDKYNPSFNKQLWVNYGNCFESLGRNVESLYAYDKALWFDKKFPMAIGNKAKAMCHFANISGKYRSEIYHEAYQLIRSIINNQDLVKFGPSDIRQQFETELKNIEAQFKDKTYLTRELKTRKYELAKLSDFERFYFDFCIKNKLFLNFHIHQDNCEASIVDPIFINLITKTSDNKTFYKLAKHINQIKEDYVTARMLLVQ